MTALPTVLIVDDEARSLESLQRILVDDFEVQVASNVQEAEALLQTEWVQIILCDQCMPDTTGVEFLTRVREQWPDVIRMIISGYTDSGDIINALNDAGVYQYITMPWHPSISEASGDEFRSLLEQVSAGDIPLDILCLVGAVVRGPGGSGRFHMLAGTGLLMMDWIGRLAGLAEYVVAVGSCAAYGGNPSDACGLQYDRGEKTGLPGESFRACSALPVVNIAACPAHPNWVTETLLQIASGQLAEKDLDTPGRRRSYVDHRVHHGCPRNEFYEFKASAEKPSDLGCMYGIHRVPGHPGACRLQYPPLERQVVDGQPLSRDLVGRSGGNVRSRVLARLLEIARVVVAMEGWARELAPGEPVCNHAPIPQEATGCGMIEAARGSLGHWLKIRNGRILNYQIIAPATWNFSPREANGTPGGLEQALVGAPLRPGEKDPVAVQHIVRSFDPCMVCTVH